MRIFLLCLAALLIAGCTGQANPIVMYPETPEFGAPTATAYLPPSAPAFAPQGPSDVNGNRTPVPYPAYNIVPAHGAYPAAPAYQGYPAAAYPAQAAYRPYYQPYYQQYYPQHQYYPAHPYPSQYAAPAYAGQQYASPQYTDSMPG